MHDEEDLVPAKQGHARWVINDGRDGIFDAIIVTVGTCGEPNMITLPGMAGYKEKEQEKEQDKEPETTDAKTHDEQSTQTDNRSSSSWTNTSTEDADSQAVARDQEEKKAQKFYTPAEAFHGEGDVDTSAAPSESPTQDNGAWEKSKLSANAWDVGRDQTQKKDEGFPTPGEAFEVGPDTQKGSEDQSLAPAVNGRTHNETKNGHADTKESHHSHPDKQADEDDNVFKGPILHSSQLDREDAPSFEGKTIVVIGGGASAVESVETALAKGAKKCIMLVRDDKVRVSFA